MYPEAHKPLAGSVNHPSKRIALRDDHTRQDVKRRMLSPSTVRKMKMVRTCVLRARRMLTWILLVSILVNSTSVTYVYAASGDFLRFEAPLNLNEVFFENIPATGSGALRALEIIEIQLEEEIEVSLEEVIVEETNTSDVGVEFDAMLESGIVKMTQVTDEVDEILEEEAITTEQPIGFDAALEPESSTETLTSSGAVLDSGSGSLGEVEVEEPELPVLTGSTLDEPDSGSGTWTGSGSTWDVPETESATGTVVTATGAVTSTGALLPQTSTGALITESGALISTGSTLVSSGAVSEVEEETQRGSVVEEEGLRQVEGLSGALLEDADHFFSSNIYPTFAIPRHREIISTQEFMERLEVKVTDPMGEEVDLQGTISEEPDRYLFMLSPPENFRPGHYHVEARLKAEHGANRKVQSFFRKINESQEEEVQDVLLYSGDVPLGLIAFNTDRPSFVQWQGANVSLSVSDENGQPVCDAEVDAEVIHPNESKTQVSTSDGSIEKIEDCGLRSIVPIPDYTFQVPFPSQGTYTITVDASTESGSVNLTQRIPVTEDPEMLDVRRQFVTRTFANHEEEMEITLIPMHTFVGKVTERIPPGFDVLESDPPAGVSESKITGAKTLTWNKRWEAGIPIVLTYYVRTPSQSPIFSLFGPLRAEGTIEDSEPEPITLPRFVPDQAAGSGMTVEEKEEKNEKEEEEAKEASAFAPLQPSPLGFGRQEGGATTDKKEDAGVTGGTGTTVVGSGSLAEDILERTEEILSHVVIETGSERAPLQEGLTGSGALFQAPAVPSVKSLIDDLVPANLLETMPSARSVRTRLMEMEAKVKSAKKEIVEPSAQERRPASPESAMADEGGSGGADGQEKNSAVQNDAEEVGDDMSDDVDSSPLTGSGIGLKQAVESYNAFLEAYLPRAHAFVHITQNVLARELKDGQAEVMSSARSFSSQIASLFPAAWLQLMDEPYRPSTQWAQAKRNIARASQTYSTRLQDAPGMIAAAVLPLKKYGRTPPEPGLEVLIAQSVPPPVRPLSMGEVATDIIERMFATKELPEGIVVTGKALPPSFDLPLPPAPTPSGFTSIPRPLPPQEEGELCHRSIKLSYSLNSSSPPPVEEGLGVEVVEGLEETLFTWTASDQYGIPHPTSVRSMEVAWALARTPLSSQESWWMQATAEPGVLPPKLVVTGEEDKDVIEFVERDNAPSRIVSYEEPRKWQLLSLATPEAATRESQLRSELTLIPIGGDTFSANALPTFKLLETTFTNTGSLLDEAGHLQTNIALREIAQVLIDQADIKRAVIRSIIEEKSDTIARNLVEDPVSMSALTVATRSGTGTTKVRKDVLELTVSDVLEDGEAKYKLAEVIEETGELDELLAQVVDEEVTDAVVEEIIEKETKETPSYAKATEGKKESEETKGVSEVRKAMENVNKHVASLLNEKVVGIMKKSKESREVLVNATKEEEQVTRNDERLTNSVISVELKDSKGNVIDSPFHYEPGSVLLALEPTRQFKPGRYTLEVTVTHPLSGEQQVLTQDFAWGVLAMNSDKDRYLPGDRAHLAFGVLTDGGEIVCDAKLNLAIETPSGEIVNLSNESGSIVTTGTCGIKEAGLIKPDYETMITLAEAGTYTLHLTAVTPNGTRTMTLEITVDPTPPFIVTRKAATRLWPFAPSEMQIEVEFFEEFMGEISEVVPSEFVITDVSESGIRNPESEHDNEQLTSFAKAADVKKTKNEKRIVWSGFWKKGDTAKFSYQYDAPDVSPEFYRVGPLELSASSFAPAPSISLLELMKNEHEQGNNREKGKSDVAKGEELAKINHNISSEDSAFSANNTENVAATTLRVKEDILPASNAAIAAKAQNAANSVQSPEKTLSPGGVQRNEGDFIGERTYTLSDTVSTSSEPFSKSVRDKEHDGNREPRTSRLMHSESEKNTPVRDRGDDAQNEIEEREVGDGVVHERSYERGISLSTSAPILLPSLIGEVDDGKRDSNEPEGDIEEHVSGVEIHNNQWEKSTLSIQNTTAKIKPMAARNGLADSKANGTNTPASETWPISARMEDSARIWEPDNTMVDEDTPANDDVSREEHGLSPQPHSPPERGSSVIQKLNNILFQRSSPSSSGGRGRPFEALRPSGPNGGMEENSAVQTAGEEQQNHTGGIEVHEDQREESMVSVALSEFDNSNGSDNKEAPGDNHQSRSDMAERKESLEIHSGAILTTSIPVVPAISSLEIKNNQKEADKDTNKGSGYVRESEKFSYSHDDSGDSDKEVSIADKENNTEPAGKLDIEVHENKQQESMASAIADLTVVLHSSSSDAIGEKHDGNREPRTSRLMHSESEKNTPVRDRGDDAQNEVEEREVGDGVVHGYFAEREKSLSVSGSVLLPLLVRVVDYSNSDSEQSHGNVEEGVGDIKIHDGQRERNKLIIQNESVNINPNIADIPDISSTKNGTKKPTAQTSPAAMQTSASLLKRTSEKNIGERPYTPHQNLSITQDDELFGAGQAPQKLITNNQQTGPSTSLRTSKPVNKSTTREGITFYEARSWQIANDAGSTSKVWDSEGADLNWSTAANWSGDSVPDGGDIVWFDGTGKTDSTVDAGFSGGIGGLRLGASFTGTLTLARDLTVSGSIVISGGTLDVSAANYDVYVSNDWIQRSGGNFNARAGTVYLTGTGDTLTLSGSNAFSNLTIDDGLVGYWKFDEGSGDKAYDSSRYGNDGTLTNMEEADWVDMTGTGITKFYNPYALDFDGVNEYMDAGDSESLDLTGDATFCAWARPNTYGYDIGSNYRYGRIFR
ncbi:MAG: hypothetical protein ABIA92_05860, partial [Patescibacteria group bacterium]